MDIYLDIDGVLLAGPARKAYFVDDFLQFILSNWPDTTYWLTPYQWRGQDRTIEMLRPVLNIKTRKMMSLVKPTKWHEYKTEAIDFKRPFQWFSADITPEEQKTLEAFHAFENWVKIDLRQNPGQLMDEITKLKYLQELL